MTTKAIKVAVVDLMKRFLDSVVDNGNNELIAFNQKPYKEKLAFTTGRLVDQAEEMLNKWREKGIKGARSPLPVFIGAFAKEYASTGLEKGQSIAVNDFIVQDGAERFFKVRVDKHDQRVQIVLFAPTHAVAFSLASQFKLFCRQYQNRHTIAYTEYQGEFYGFALTLEDNNIFGTNAQISEQDNLTVCVFDLNFNCNTPYFLGNVEQNEPYLSVVQAVKITQKNAKSQRDFYHHIVGEPFKEIE